MGLVGASTSGSRKRFPLAAQQEIMRAAKKDDQYVSLVYAACRDAFCHGTRVIVAYQNEPACLALNNDHLIILHKKVAELFWILVSNFPCSLGMD
uniref:Uncharacterized protein n=1 Tax=Solanum lycopersicum TaxID=4081 RepID=A0A3Q7HPU0_SOLLC